ncbi:MAG: cobamide remodeling phosphodiesterase CbiR [Thermodesulfobacteriota bacterium]
MTREPVSYKGVYPFSLACPSFIYPAGYAENTRRLSGLVDEIELLFFQSAPESMPDPDEIEALKNIGHNGDVVYNVHLPIDISIAGADAAEGRRAREAVIGLYDRVRELSPVSWTLHVPMDAAEPRSSRQWADRACGRIEEVLACRRIPSRSMALETLDYSPFILGDIAERLDCSICLDTGHLMARGIDCKTVFDALKDRVTIVHAHGVSQGRDHLALDRLSPSQQKDMGHILQSFRGTFCLEVFCSDHLFSSMDCLNRLWHTL